MGARSLEKCSLERIRPGPWELSETAAPCPQASCARSKARRVPSCSPDHSRQLGMRLSACRTTSLPAFGSLSRLQIPFAGLPLSPTKTCLPNPREASFLPSAKAPSPVSSWPSSSPFLSPLLPLDLHCDHETCTPLRVSWKATWIMSPLL